MFFGKTSSSNSKPFGILQLSGEILENFGVALPHFDENRSAEFTYSYCRKLQNLPDLIPSHGYLNQKEESPPPTKPLGGE